jgi:chemotaxis protein methyltransferase WspC
MTSPYYERMSSNARHAVPDNNGNDSATTNYSIAGSPAFDSGILRIEELLSKKIGLEPKSIGRKRIADIVKAHMKPSMVDDVNKYLHMLESDPEELEKLIGDVTVHETWFFRDSESFNYLKKYVHEIKPSVSDRNIFKVLSLPCSTGEEPYSIAIALLENGLLPEHFQIDAIDINPKAIEAAKRAFYGKGAFRGERRDYKDKYFTCSKEGFKLDPAIAGLVTFYRDNFMQPHALWDHGPYHVIFCKNLLIYLTDDARKKIFDNINRFLLPNGIIFTGHAELMSFLQYGYSAVKHSRSFACRKIKAEEDSASHKGERLNPPDHLQTDEKLKKSFYKRDEAILIDAKADTAINMIVPEAGMKKLKRDDKLSISMIQKLADGGSLDQALSMCEQFLKKNKPSKEAYYLMGLINLALDIFDKAEDFFQKALYLDPYHYEALLHMKLLYEKKGDHVKASAMKGRIERLNGSNEQRVDRETRETVNGEQKGLT